MQPVRKLREILENFGGEEHYLFSVSDFFPIFPDLAAEALRMLLCRAAAARLLQRVCKGIYLYPKASYPKGLVLYHTAARLRENYFSYLSMESVLSETGIISQMPLGWITVMTGGRSGKISCGKWGVIEFIHTKKSPDRIRGHIQFDKRRKLWRAGVPLALRDMQNAKRPKDLIDWSAAHEFF
jgi:predicted transcriptional regulator of viral defense system